LRPVPARQAPRTAVSLGQAAGPGRISDSWRAARRLDSASQPLLAIASRRGGSLAYPAALLGRSHSLMTADQEGPLPVYTVTLRDRSDRLRAAPGGRQRADPDDRQHCRGAGLLADMLLPGRRSQGLILTCLIGVAGALCGGWLATKLFHVHTLHGGVAGAVAGRIGDQADPCRRRKAPRRLVKCPLLAGRQAHHAVLPAEPADSQRAGPAGGKFPALRGAPPGWFRPRCPPAWPQERRTGSSRGQRKGRRPPSPLRPAVPPGLLPPRWERTARDPPAGRRRATSSSGSARRSLQAALQAARRPARAPAPTRRGAARRHMTGAGAERVQRLGHVRASGSTPELATGVWSGSTLR
jgi:uncharacterized membrane protein YeaQ/YmgE (transglycosylase-associated protein family)